MMFNIKELSAISGILFSCSILSCTGYKLVKLGSFSIGNPAFTNLYPGHNGSVDLLISTFVALNPFGHDSVQIVQNVNGNLKDVSSIKPRVLTTDVTWPNEISGVPVNVFKKRMVAIPDGFLVPFKNDGSISILDISTPSPSGPIKITDDSTGQWFYHRVEWRDMDGDGLIDAITCRAKEPAFGSGKDAELLWLKNPGSLQSPWKPNVIAHRPDIFFRNIEMHAGDKTLNVILTAQFFTTTLAVYWTESPDGLWNDTTTIKSRVIDYNIGALFEVVVTDLNGDGHPDLLVTTNGNGGSLYAYEIPKDFRYENFTRHTLANGFTPRRPGTGKGAPGAPIAIHPNTKASKGTKPSILLSGDDDGRAYYLEPKSTDSGNWTYSIETFLDAGQGTVGEISAADVDKDGLVEVFVPSYDTSQLFVFRFSN